MGGGYQGSTRRKRLPPNWDTLRGHVINRARGQCEHTTTQGQRCPHPGTDVDHVQRGDDHALSNLQLLCRKHHAQKTAQEANNARLRGQDKHPDEQHPALR